MEQQKPEDKVTAEGVQSGTADASRKKKVDELMASYYNHLVEVLIQGECFESYRKAKVGQLLGGPGIVERSMEEAAVEAAAASSSDDDDDDSSEANRSRGDGTGDIFGTTNQMVKKMDCDCPHCQRNLSASRLAPHLEKCMGMGRNSSRVASQRIANIAKPDAKPDKSPSPSE